MNFILLGFLVLFFPSKALNYCFKQWHITPRTNHLQIICPMRTPVSFHCRSAKIIFNIKLVWLYLRHSEFGKFLNIIFRHVLQRKHMRYIYHKMVYGTPRNMQEFAYSEMWQEVSTNRDRKAVHDNSLPSPWLTREVNPFS